jgi:hypothetical protein
MGDASKALEMWLASVGLKKVSLTSAERKGFVAGTKAYRVSEVVTLVLVMSRGTVLIVGRQ